MRIRSKGSQNSKIAFQPRLFTVTVWVVLLLLICSGALFSHPGGLDSYGGHYNRTTDKYHLHGNAIIRLNLTVSKMSDDAIEKLLQMNTDQAGEKFFGNPASDDRELVILNMIFSMAKKERRYRKDEREFRETLAGVIVLAGLALFFYSGLATKLFCLFLVLLWHVDNNFGFHCLRFPWYARILKTLLWSVLGLVITFCCLWIVSDTSQPSEILNITGILIIITVSLVGLKLTEVNGLWFGLNALLLIFPLVGAVFLLLFAILAGGPDKALKV